MLGLDLSTQCPGPLGLQLTMWAYSCLMVDIYLVLLFFDSDSGEQKVVPEDGPQQRDYLGTLTCSIEDDREGYYCEPFSFSSSK